MFNKLSYKLVLPGLWPTFGLFGWLLHGLCAGALSADPKMPLVAPLGGAGLCG